MAYKTFYSSTADNNRKTDVIPGTGDWYIQEYIYMSTAVYANTTAGTSTLTPATSPGWTINGLQSTVAKNLLIYDDNNKVATALIASNTATAITFDETACLHEVDDTTAATLTPGSTYNIYVLTPSSVAGQIYGPYFGFAEGVSISMTDDVMKLYSGFPERLQFSDLRRREATISGGHVNLINKDIGLAVLGGVEYGNNTGGNEAFGIGSSPTRGIYRLSIKQQDKNSTAKTCWLTIRQVQFNSNGDIMGDAQSGHKMINFSGDILADSFYPVGVDMIQRKRLA